MDKIDIAGLLMRLSEILGVKSAVSTVWSFLGALVSLSFMPSGMPWKRIIVGIVSGTVVGVGFAPLVLHSIGLQELYERPISFLLGVSFMPLGPVLIERAQTTVRSGRLPWGKE